MNDKVLIELRTALFPPENIGISVSRGEQRISQFLSGLNFFFDQMVEVKEVFNPHFIFVDNTISKISDVPKEIRRILEKNKVEIYTLDKNYYGKRNKGAGDIEVWREYINKILGYKWFLHFEPRTIMKTPDFVLSFYQNKRDLFKIIHNSDGRPHFYTGIFSIESERLKCFTESVDLNYMVNNSISIEYLLKDFMDKTFPDYSIYSEKLNIIWHDSAQNRFIEF